MAARPVSRDRTFDSTAARAAAAGDSGATAIGRAVRTARPGPDRPRGRDPRGVRRWSGMGPSVSQPEYLGNADTPAYLAASPSSSSIRSSWLYFAVRSERAGAPDLICPQLVATARSAIVV